MAQEKYRTVVCASCGNELDIPAPPSADSTEERLPCPNCGATAREYRIGLSASIAVGGGEPITETPEPDGAIAGGFGPTAVVNVGASAPRTSPSPAPERQAGTLERNVIWSKNPDAWLAEVRDGGGNLLGVEIGLDGDDVYLDLRDLLGPP